LISKKFVETLNKVKEANQALAHSCIDAPNEMFGINLLTFLVETINCYITIILTIIFSLAYILLTRLDLLRGKVVGDEVQLRSAIQAGVISNDSTHHYDSSL
jgi:hypothetical protein